MKLPRTLFIVAALLGPLLVLGGSGTRAAAPGPTVPYHDSYPITVVAGDYDLAYWVLDFAPGAGMPLHYHGGPTAMLDVDGELTVRSHDGSERTLKPTETANVEAGAHHVMVNTSAASARLLGVTLLPKGAKGTTFVDTTTKMPGPTVSFYGSYPITAVAGEYTLINNVLAFAPGAAVPLHYHGGPAIIVGLDGELSIQASGHAHMLMPGDLDTQAAGAQHVMMNMGAGQASALFGVLLPKGAQLTTFVQAPPVGMPSTGASGQDALLALALVALGYLALGGYLRSRRVKQSENL